MYCVINCIAKVKPKFTSENIATSRKNQSNEHEWTILPATKKIKSPYEGLKHDFCA